MVLAVGGLIVNRAGHYLTTVGDIFGSLSSQSTGTGNVLPLATSEELDEPPADAWKATFEDGGDGSRVTTWAGPISGVDLQVKVILPSGYKADDGRTYAVIEELHGYTGTPDSMIDGLQSPESLQAAIDAGRIPPTIIVIPSLDVDDNPHDCANLQGRPAVGTWAAQEIPRMVQASFPNVAADRQAWMIMGISSGAYCAAWTAIENSDQFGSAGAISAFNEPIEGGLANSGRWIAEKYTLSTMLAEHDPSDTRFYIMGAQDDPLGSAQTAWRMADAVREVRRMKARVETERIPRGIDPQRHLKLGRGGLADVEWTVQLLQLQHAGDHPRLRTTSTLDALTAAADVGLVTADQADRLSCAWDLASRLRDLNVLGTGRTSASKIDVLAHDLRDLAVLSFLMGRDDSDRHDIEEEYLRAARRSRGAVERIFYGKDTRR